MNRRGHVIKGLAFADMNPEPGRAELLMKVHLCPGEDLAMPIKDMKYVEGSKGFFANSILCLGGQILDEPDTLSLVSLDSLAQVSFHVLPSLLHPILYITIKSFKEHRC